VQPVRRGRERDLRVDYTRFNDRDALRRIEVQNAVEAIQRDDDAVSDGQRPTGETRAASACDEGQPFIVAAADQRDHFFRSLRHRHGERARAERREAIAFVRGELLRLRKKSLGWKKGCETVKLCLDGEHGQFSLNHGAFHLARRVALVGQRSRRVSPAR
jgi:hypothetical protein